MTHYFHKSLQQLYSRFNFFSSLGGPDKGLVASGGGCCGSYGMQEEESSLLRGLMEQHISAWRVSNPTAPRDSAPCD